MGALIDTREIIWPNRFDLLVRIDFLEWFEAIGRHHLPLKDVSKITKSYLISYGSFLVRAKEHPYFIQYTKLKRGYRLLNLNYQNAGGIYAEGIENFIKLHEAIKTNSFDLKKRINVKRPLFKPLLPSKHLISRNNYIGDGCHRFACLVWSRKSFLIPKKFFRIRLKVICKPDNANLTAGYKALGILTDQDIIYFNRIFQGAKPEIWESAFDRFREIRERYTQMDIEGMFDIRFNSLDFKY